MELTWLWMSRSVYAAESGAGDRLQISADSSSEGAHRLYVIKRDDGTLLCRGILHQTM